MLRVESFFLFVDSFDCLTRTPPPVSLSYISSGEGRGMDDEDDSDDYFCCWTSQVECC